MKTEISLIPVARIRVVNPRVRDKRKFVRVLESIRNVGLKKPIQVSPREVPPGDPPAYDLICGQGRMEAFQMLGNTRHRDASDPQRGDAHEPHREHGEADGFAVGTGR
jgi:ParB-like chromosome segregation protein Spo0J